MKDIFDELTVVKRSGQRVTFNGTKIAIAIKSAFDSVYITNNEKNVNKVYESVLLFIENNYSDRKTINVEDIQDIIEKKLIEFKFIDVYASFNEYRLKRAESRKAFSMKQQHKFVKTIERIATSSLIKQEGIKPMDILLDFGKTVSSEFTKAYILDSKSFRAHEEGIIYIHDLDYFNLGMLHSTHLKIDENYMVNNFPNNFINNCLELKEEIDGEISLPLLDKKLNKWLIENFKIIYKETLKNYLILEGIIGYINFFKIEKLIDNIVTIEYDETLYETMILNEKVKNIFKLAYNNTLDILNKKLYESLKDFLMILDNNHKENKKYSISIGDNSKESIFIKKVLFSLIEELEPLKNITLILKTSSVNIKDIVKLIDKNIAINNEKNVEYFSDGKRIYENIYSEYNSIGRMVVATTSVNLSRLGFECTNINSFYDKLDSILELVKNQLLLVFEKIGDKTKENYHLLFKNNVIDDEKLDNNQHIRKIIKNGTLNIGIVGLKECVINLSQDDINQKKLALEILTHINKMVLKFSNETKLNFCLTETSKKKPLKELIALDKTIYGINKYITDTNYYQRIDSLFDYKNIDEDFKYISQYQKMMNGGNKFELKISARTSSKRIEEIIETVIDNDIRFIKICKGEQT